MAIALDAVSSRQADTVTSLTFSFTCTGTNRILFVGFNMDADTCTGVTYNGVAMTQVGKVQSPGGRFAYLYYLIAPTTGANNVVISSSGSTTIIAYAISYTGAKQSGQPDASTTNTASSVTSITTSVTTIAVNCWTIISGRSNGAGSSYVGGSGTTYRANGTNADHLADSNGALTPAGSKSLIIQWTTNDTIGVIMASFAPDVSSPSASVSPSASLSPSASISRSISPSSSLSPSSSVSLSLSPSSSASLSLSPSASVSPSASTSASISPSSSVSSSLSPSASVSATPSPSSSASASVSASPSVGYSQYSRGNYTVLPTNDNDLEVLYTDEEEGKVASDNGIRVGQEAALEYMVHQFKSFVGSETFGTVYWEGQSTLAPRSSIVSLQIYNHNTGVWETIASNNYSPHDNDFELTDTITDLTNYKDTQNVVTCRVQQLAT